MGGVYFDGLTLPKQCYGCSFRDVEYDGGCELMPQADYCDYESQFSVCPIQAIARLHPATIIPENATITSFKYEVDVAIRRKT